MHLTVWDSQCGAGHNVVLGKEVASELFQTYYGGGRFYEGFLGWLRNNGGGDELISMIEAASWHL